MSAIGRLVLVILTLALPFRAEALTEQEAGKLLDDEINEVQADYPNIDLKAQDAYEQP